MPAQTMEQVQQREAASRKSLAAEGLEPGKARSLRKTLKRAQRKRRRLAVEAARKTAQTAGAKKSADEAASE